MKLKLLIYIFFLANKFAFAQDPYYTPIDKSSGLPSNTVYDIFQDSKGFMWFATDKGLVKYDGFEFRLFINPSQSSKAGTNISEDRQGRIWYQNFDGYVFYVEKDSLYALKQETPIGYFNYGIVNNQLFLIKKNGINIYDLKNLQIINSIQRSMDKCTKTIADKNYFYINEGNTVYKIENDFSVSTIEQHDSLSTNFSFLNIGQDILLCGLIRANNYSIYKLKNQSHKMEFSLSESIIQNASFADSSLWLCTKQGVYAFDEKYNKLNSGIPFFKKYNISYVFKDRENNFWFSTLNKGLLFVKNMDTKLFFADFSPLKCVLSSNTLFVSSNTKIIYQVDLNSFEAKQYYTSQFNQESNMLFYDSLHKNILLSHDYLEIINSKSKALYQKTGAVKAARIVDDNYYALAYSGMCALYKIDKNKKDEWTKIFNENRNSKNEEARFLLGCRARAVEYLQGKQTVYFGTSYGLNALTPSGIREIQVEGKRIFAESLFRFENLIYGLTSEGEIFKIQDNKVLFENIELPGRNEFINSIKVCENYLFIISNYGLYSLDLRENNSKLILQHKINYDVTDIELWQNKIIVVSNKGLIFESIRTIANADAQPIFYINNVQVNGLRISDFKNQKLNHKQNNLEINYSILSFKTDSKFPLYYKINENAWQLASSETRQLLLSSLSPGNYFVQFKLGETKEKVSATLVFEIAKPWWQTGLAIGTFIFLIVAVFYFIYQWQTTILKKQNQLLEQKVKLEKDLRLTTLKSIKAQMNPHFFYNALNTIQNFIFSDDKRNASTYLSKFSKLTRTILEMSEKENVSLAEELEALKLYLEIEKVRFNQDFDFKIELKEIVNPDLIKIPSMLVQPYVENAIKHGLLHKTGEKKLAINFSLEANFLIVSIDDNGIGRIRSAEINRVKNNLHKPFATEANLTRIDILNKGKEKVGVNYHDKKDDLGISFGTLVTLKILLE